MPNAAAAARLGAVIDSYYRAATVGDGGIGQAVLPEPARTALRWLRQRVFQATGLPLELVWAMPDAAGRLEATLRLGHVRFVDPARPGATPGFEVPTEALNTVRRAIVADAAFAALPPSASGALRALSRAIWLVTAADFKRPAPGSPLLAAAVGPGGAPHDVAVLQAALQAIARPGGQGRFWNGRIDGQATPGLFEPLRQFQASRLLAPSGRLAPNDDTERALRVALPPALRGLRGVKGTAAAMLAGPGTEPLALPVAVPQPQLAQALAPVAARVQTAFGLPFGPAGRVNVSVYDARIPVTFGGGHFLDPSGRPLPARQAPPALREPLARLLAGSEFALDPNRPALTLRYRPSRLEDLDDIEVSYLPLVAVVDLADAVANRLLDANRLLREYNLSLDMVATAGFDAGKAAKVAQELGLSGQVRHLVLDGKAYLVVTGASGTALLEKGGARMAMLAIGEAGERAALGRVTVVGVAVVGSVEILSYLQGEQTFLEALAGIGVGSTKVGIATVAGYLAAAIIGGATVSIIVPLVVGTVVSVGIGAGLEWLDRNTGVTDALKRSIRSNI